MPKWHIWLLVHIFRNVCHLFVYVWLKDWQSHILGNDDYSRFVQELDERIHILCSYLHHKYSSDILEDLSFTLFGGTSGDKL